MCFIVDYMMHTYFVLCFLALVTTGLSTCKINFTYALCFDVIYITSPKQLFTNLNL